MKKIICSFLTIMLLTTSAFAAEITFRDIPWGVSMSEVEKAFAKKLFFTHDEYQMRYWSNIEQDFDLEHIGDYPSGWYGYSAALGELRVAGYDALPIMFCAYGLSSDDKVLRDKDKSVFYAGGYAFAVIDHESTYFDLREKLTGLYGDGIEKIDDGEGVYSAVNGNGTYHYESRCTTWIGDNNTSVKLYCHLNDADDSMIGANTISLWYGKPNADEYLEKLQNVIHREKLLEEQANRSGDISGL